MFQVYARMVERKEEILMKMIWGSMSIFRCAPIGADSFTCQCVSGYTGATCETTTSTSNMKFIFF